MEHLTQLRIDLVGLRVSKVTVGGRATPVDASAGDTSPSRCPDPLEPGEATSVTLTYAGNPGPSRSVWGEVGWEELDDGVLVASQPTGAPTWFPCNDHPALQGDLPHRRRVRLALCRRA